MLSKDLFRDLQTRRSEMTTALDRIVSVESPTADPAATRACAEEVAALGEELLARPPQRLQSGDYTHLLWSFGSGGVLIVGHFDTVWPVGTTARWPFRIDDGVATGPGVFDMKAGIVQGLFAVAALADPAGLEILFNADEETGSQSSKALIQEAAQRARAVLVLEPSEKGALKTARKGGASYKFRIEGRAAHAGLEPEKGANALSELARVVQAVERMARADMGTTVTPTVGKAGTADNVVPALATLSVDVRTRTRDEQQRVDQEMRSLKATIPGVRLELVEARTRPPLEPAMSAALFERARAIGDTLGLGSLAAVEVGGGSDGNLTAALGIPTLDGLGAVGEGAHAEGEHIFIDAMAERAALVAALVEQLLRE